ncbi:MAG: hypothetical protein HWD90_01880 [Campylobacteraceae bacterium]|nr:hypothetical protein [Campylobacteraceae bacterium]
MSHNVEVRRLPKKTIVIIAIMSIVTIIGFAFITFTKNLKMEEVLSTLGHKNISDIQVVNRMSVEDKETKIKSTVYKVTFFDKTLNKECIGFVHRSNHGKYSKDIDCK